MSKSEINTDSSIPGSRNGGSRVKIPSLPVSDSSNESDEDATAGKSQQQIGTADDPTRYGDWVKNGRCIDF